MNPSEIVAVEPELDVDPVIGSKQLQAEVIRAALLLQLSSHVGVGIADVV